MLQASGWVFEKGGQWRFHGMGNQPGTVVGFGSSAHLLPCSSGGQDVQLGELSRVFLGLEAQRGDTGGPAVCCD